VRTETRHERLLARCQFGLIQPRLELSRLPGEPPLTLLIWTVAEVI
jgi:hypothetical protein